VRRAKNFIRAEEFNIPPLGAVKKVLNPDCNSLLRTTNPAACTKLDPQKFTLYKKRQMPKNHHKNQPLAV
jgi:hypothetical protein